MLELRNQLGQRYNAECRVLVSRLNPNAYTPGMEIAVKIDPNNEQNVVPDFGSANSFTAVTSPRVNPQINEAALKSEIEQVQKENEAISISGKSARAIIKKHTWLGVNVNGNNPYVELELEILPDQYPAFSGRTRAVIAETSVSKYQPGQQISVKYDLYDNSKAVIIQEV